MLRAMTSAKTSNNKTSNGGTASTYRFRTGENPIALTLSRSRQFVYVANWGAHNISAYRICTTTGRLSPVEGSPFASGLWPHSISASEKFSTPPTANPMTFRRSGSIRRAARFSP
jgi:hypothetical protein